MNKRAQVIGQVFIFILAGLVFVLILFYGYRAITEFLARGEEVQLLDFRNSLDSAVSSIKRDYGSVRQVTLRVPPQTQDACFVTSAAQGADTAWELQLREEYPLMYESWKTGSENVFLIPRQETPFFIPDVVVENGYACIQVVNSKVVLRVEGRGSTARISPWTV